MTKRTVGDFPISPTTDWGRDLDILDPRYVADPSGVWRELRDGCPVAFSERRGRAWMPVNYDDIAAIAHDTTHFSSRRIGVIDLPESEREGRPLLTAPPITSDPPDHTWARRILLPAFSPHQIEVMTPITRAVPAELLDGFAGLGHAGCGSGLCAAHPGAGDRAHAGCAGVRRGHVHQLGGAHPAGGLQRPRREPRRDHRDVGQYFGARVDERAALPADHRPDDLITLLVETEIDGEPLDRRHLLGTCFLLLLAGIDTTWSAIGSSLWHLATHPADQARLRAEPDLIDSASRNSYASTVR